MSHNLRPLDEITFTNSFVDELPGETAPHKRPRQVPGFCYSRVEPTPVRDPRMLAWTDDFAEFLQIARPEERSAATNALAGNLVLPTMKPFAARYGGHQFGSWSGQLGDGRAMSLGEVTARDGSTWELQLKGAGPTPYSRGSDGRAVLRSSVREFLCSEAMYHLGVPTTRAISLVATGDIVVRDMFYSGDPRPEPGAIVTRVAPTFIRFGTFEIMATLNEIDNLRALADYTIRHHYPELGEPGEAAYLKWFNEIARRTAVMIAHWMSVGFVHGVMNTDNMSILGVTIDYGPYGWLEPYDPNWTPNTTDFGGRRYAFGQQPRIALWNLLRLGEAISPLVSNIEDLNAGLDCYRSTLAETQHAMTLKKLGLTRTPGEDDAALIQQLQQCLESSEMDMTIFFRKLSHLAPELKSNSADHDAHIDQLIVAATYAAGEVDKHARLREWFNTYTVRLRMESGDSNSVRESMLSVNPKYVLRNYLAQNAIEKATAGDFSYLYTLMRVLKSPYDEQPEHDELAGKRPDWAADKPGCATLSCSS